MRYFCGVDIGASALKLVLIDDTGRVVARAVRRSGVDYAETANRCLSEALSAAGLAPDSSDRTPGPGPAGFAPHASVETTANARSRFSRSPFRRPRRWSGGITGAA